MWLRHCHAKRLGEFRRSVPGFDARRGRVFGTAEDTGLICILSSGGAASPSGLTRSKSGVGVGVGAEAEQVSCHTAPKQRKKVQTLIIRRVSSYSTLHTPIGWALWSVQYWLMQLAPWLISSGELAKSVSGKYSFSVWKWSTHETLGRKSNAVQVILLPVFVWSHLESKLRVSTVIQWQDRSTGCN